MLRVLTRTMEHIQRHPTRQLSRLFSTQTSGMNEQDVLQGADPEQIRMMAERVILVDREDRVIGHMSKKESHLTSNDLPLHRAFSVFLFDTKGRMLLQQRAATKVTFPSYWTNTVCSHPLYIPSELGQHDEGNEVIGTKRAALRKLSHELGVSEGAMDLDDLHYMTRIHYRADCQDGVWGEHEMDYVFMAMKDITLKPEPNEVSSVRYVSQKELRELISEADASDTLHLTPWFRYIVDGFAWPWWDKLLKEGTDGLGELQDHHIVHRMGDCGKHS